MNPTAHNGAKADSDDAFFIDMRSTKVDDVLAGRITYSQYFDDVDRRAMERASRDAITNEAKNVQLDALQRRLFLIVLILGALLFIIYIVILIATFRGEGNVSLRWLSSATSAVMVALGGYLIRGKFDIFHRKESVDEKSQE